MFGTKYAGLGLVPPVKPVIEQCGAAFSINDPCVARNTAAGEKYQKELADYMAAMGFNITYTDYVPQYIAPSNTLFVPAPVYTLPINQVTQPPTNNQPTPSSPKPISGGSLNWHSTGPSVSVLYPGDTWGVTIVGASPNQSVVSKGLVNGVAYSTVMGSTDSSGMFTKTGTITAGDVGSYQEGWYVGGVISGNITFSVKPAIVPKVAVQSQTAVNPTVTQQETNTTNGVPVSDVFGTTVTDTMNNLSDSVSQFMTKPWIEGVDNKTVMIGAAAAIAAVMLISSSKGGRRF